MIWVHVAAIVLVLLHLFLRADDREREPTLYGFTLGSRITSVVPWLELDLEYQQVSAWVYRTLNDQYSFLQRGLGTNFSDFDRFTLATHVFTPVPNLRLTPMIQFQRQGEGDLRDSLPPLGEYLGSEVLFLGVKERSGWVCRGDSSRISASGSAGTSARTS